MFTSEKGRLAMDIVRRAGDFAQASRAILTIEHKSDNDYVTQMDRQTEQTIKEALLALDPTDGFLGEEYGQSGSEAGEWVLDPIDGTSNYMRGLAEYAVSLAYMEKGLPIFGMVYCPALGLLYRAEKGKGAFCNDKPIHVTGENRLRDTLVAFAFAHRNPDVMPRMFNLIHDLSVTAGDLRRCGSAALDLCRVADGSFGAYVEPCLHLYDIAAGVLILQEAGGKATDFSGEGNVLTTCNVCASNMLLHEDMLNLISKSFPVDKI